MKLHQHISDVEDEEIESDEDDHDSSDNVNMLQEVQTNIETIRRLIKNNHTR
jgi:hypothetical protein